MAAAAAGEETHEVILTLLYSAQHDLSLPWALKEMATPHASSSASLLPPQATHGGYGNVWSPQGSIKKVLATTILVSWGEESWLKPLHWCLENGEYLQRQ